jgi:hypothetical protein
MREGQTKQVQASRPSRADRKRAARLSRVGREEREKILRVQNLLAKAHSSRLSGVPRTLS